MKSHFLLSILLLATLMFHEKAQAAVFYASTSGSDGNTGLGPGPGQALRTIQAGVNRLQPGDTLMVRGGTYRETVVFPHSGTAERPISLMPYHGEEPVVTGSDPISGWTLHDAAKGIWKAPMPWTLGLGRNEVSAGSQVMIEARFPKKPAPGLGMYVSDLSPLWPTFGEFSIPQETRTSNPGRVVSKLLEGQPDDYWKGALYYGIHYEGWCGQTGVIESSRSGEITVGDRTQGWWFGPAYGGASGNEEGRGMIVGHMHALDQPGEWVWQDNTLYLIPLDAKPPREVEAKHRQLAFDLTGREYIHIKGLTVRFASMRLEESAHCVIEACHLSYISHFIRQYGIGKVEHDRDTMKSGETGIYISGHDNAFLSCSVRFSAGAGFYLRGYHQTIHNCLIDQVSYTAHYLNAITDAVDDYPDYENFLVGGHVITYNTMCNAGRHFFNFYGNGTSLASRTRSGMDYMGTLFAHNHLYNGMLQTRDAGFITGYYCSAGSLDGIRSQVIYNVMHDSYDISAMRWGLLGIVYLDAGTCNVDLHDNLLWAAPGSLQRGLWYNTMCVDVHESDNVFHTEFKRTCAELQPSDFPRGKPFRFGHDFANPPPVPTWPQLERVHLSLNSAGSTATSGRPSSDSPAHTVARPGTEAAGKPSIALSDGTSVGLANVDFTRGWQSAVMSFSSGVKALNDDTSARQAPRHRKATDPLVMEVTSADGKQDGIRQQWTFIYNVADRAWIRFNQVPLGQGYRRFRVIYGNDQPAPRKLEVHLDSADGPLAGTVNLPQTDRARGGRIQVYAAAVGEVPPSATGTHDIFLVFYSPDGKPVGEFEYFRFEQYRGQIPLQKHEVKFELRLDSQDGSKVGTFFPRFTGDGSPFRLMVAPLEPVTGNHPLFLVVRSAVAGPLGSLGDMSLEKAKVPIDWTGIGVPPLMRSSKGPRLAQRMVLPQPTNLPCDRPAGRYAPALPARERTIATATLLAKPSLIDGKLPGWPGGALTLSQDYDGTAAAAPESQAWVAYDAGALYIALRNPVRNAGKLLPSHHQWGVEDGVEVALEDASAPASGRVLTLHGYPDGHFSAEDYGGAPPEVVSRLQKTVSFRDSLGPAEWTCEWRIPFSACGFTPRTAPVIGFNLGVRKTAPAGWVVWRGTGGPTYQVGSAGLLVFPSEMLAAGLIEEKLLVHLDASNATSVIAGQSGKVSVWKDARGHDAHQPDERFQPLLAPHGMNGRPVLHFDATSATRLDMADLADQKITGTVITVISNPVPAAEVNHDQRIFTASDGKGFDYQVGIAASVPGLETGGPRILVSTFKGAWAKDVRVGCFSPTYQTFFTGDIAEILVYSRNLEPAEMERVRAYLAVKWGLSPESER